ncbi:MAG: TonB family protein [Alistipes sp.]|nr:TonB family protein [Alistipes sp.]
MFDVLIYLGHSALCLAALYIIYKAAMSYETLHRLNRVVLLGSLAVSALLPLCKIKITEEVEAEWVECNNFYLPDSETISAVEAVEPFDYAGLLKSVAAVVFLLGLAFMVVRLVMSTLSVWRLIRSGRVEWLEDGISLTVVDKLPSPFSYFGHIVVAESDLAENRDLILEHELAHIRLHHSWDVLAVDLALIVWWFNPALWLLRRELQSLHEYQADDSVLRRGVDAKTYQLLLIKRAVGSRLYSIANCLNHSNLKNRITMMCKKKSSRWSAAKLLFVLPLVALSLAATATTVYVTVDNIDESKVKQKSENNQTQSRIEERTFDTEVVKDDKFALSPAGSERYNLVPAEANVATQQSEKREIKGKVVDEQGKPIGGVFVLIKNKPFGAATDSEGDFGGLKVTDGDYLEISHVGYERQEVAVKGRSSFTIFLKTKIYTTETAAEVSSEPAVLKAEVMPKFMGGDLNKFRNWVQMHIKYPKVAQEQGIQGRVIAEFVIEKDGKVSFSKIMESPHESLSAEIEGAIRHSPNWTPGTNGGKPVRVKMHIPVNFAMRNSGPVNNANKGNDEDQPLMKGEILPSFQGGNLDTYRSWVESEVVYPKKLLRKKIGGRVTVEFIIDKDGTVIFSKIMQSPHELLSAEVERVIKSSPKWSPGKQRGEPVMTKMQLPVEFTVPQKSRK